MVKMGYLKEYIDKNMKPNDLFAELQNLTERYKDSTGRYLYLYVAAMSKRIPGISMEQDDFYIIRDMLQNLENEKEIDVYIWSWWKNIKAGRSRKF